MASLTDAPRRVTTLGGLHNAEQRVAPRSSPLDAAFLFLTALIPVELAIQAAAGLDFALGRIMLPTMVVMFLLFRSQTTKFTLPPRILWCAPWFIVAFFHIMLSGDWYPIYNYRTYVLNAACSIVIFNYAKTNKPSLTAVLIALFIGVAIFSLLSATGIIEPTQRTERFRVLELDENGIGGICGLGTVIAVILCVRPNYPFVGKIFTAGIGLLCLWLTIRTGSRGALAALAIPIFLIASYIAVYRKNSSFLISLFVFSVILLGGKTFYDQSDVMQVRLNMTLDENADSGERFAYRDILFFESWRMVFEKPISGWGEKPAWDELGTRLRRSGSTHLATHNTFMQIMVTSGLICGAMFWWYMFQPYIGCWRFLRNADFVFLLLLLTHYYAASLTLDQLGYRFWWWVFPLILARQQDLAPRWRIPVRGPTQLDVTRPTLQ